MTRDPIVEEVRRIRDRFARSHGYDLHAIARALQRDEAKSAQRVVTLPARKLQDKRAKTD